MEEPLRDATLEETTHAFMQMYNCNRFTAEWYAAITFGESTGDLQPVDKSEAE